MCRETHVTRGPPEEGGRRSFKKIAIFEAWKAFPQLKGVEGESVPRGLKSMHRDLKMRKRTCWGNCPSSSHAPLEGGNGMY